MEKRDADFSFFYPSEVFWFLNHICFTLIMLATRWYWHYHQFNNEEANTQHYSAVFLQGHTARKWMALVLFFENKPTFDKGVWGGKWRWGQEVLYWNLCFLTNTESGMPNKKMKTKIEHFKKRIFLNAAILGHRKGSWVGPRNGLLSKDEGLLRLELINL